MEKIAQNKKEEKPDVIESNLPLSPEEGQALSSIKEVINDSNEKIVTDIEEQVATVLAEINAPTTAYQKIMNGVRETFKKTNIKNLVSGVFLTVLSQGTAFSANNENPSDVLLDADRVIESPLETKDSNVDKGEKYFFENKDGDKKDGGGDLEGPKVKKFEKFFEAGFQMGKADLSPEQAYQLENQFIDFLSTLPQEIKDKINAGESKIVVEGSTSHHAIDKNVGTNSGSRGKVYDNETLANYRAQEGVNVLQEKVLESVQGIDSARIETSTRQYLEEESKDVLEDGRKLRIIIEDFITEPGPSGLDELVNNLPQGEIKFILNDASESNKGYAGELFKAVKESGHLPESGKVPFYVGTDYRDVVTNGSVSHPEGADNLTKLAKNEAKKSPDRNRKFTNTEDMINASMAVIEKLPNVLYDDRIEGEVGSGVIVTDESISISLDQVKKLKAKEGHKDIKLVYMLSNRDGRETVGVTLDQIEDILVNKVAVGEDSSRKISIDVNETEINGGSADYIISK